MRLKTTNFIYNSASNYYSDNLAYHNFNHIKETLVNAENILRECDSNKIPYDEKIVCHAILFHDAGYDLDCAKKGFANKEAFSASIAEDVLFTSGESSHHIEKVKNAILSTHIDGECHSNDEMIVRAADLTGLAAPYSDFIKKTIALYKEREFMLGEKITWDQYKQEASNIVRGFLRSQIKLDIELFAKGNYMFHTKVFHNLDKLMKDKLTEDGHSSLYSATSSAVKV